MSASQSKRSERSSTKGFSNVIGFDDGPFAKGHHGSVALCGAVYAKERFDGVLFGAVEKDGDDVTDAIVHVMNKSRFLEHAQCILLSGLSFGGFNIADVPQLSARLDRPVLVVTRRMPDYPAIRKALLEKVVGGKEKWAKVKAAGKMERAAGVFVQRANLTYDQAVDTLRIHRRFAKIPECLRVAHLVAAAHVMGHSHGGA